MNLEFYAFSFISLILTTVYLIYNKKAAEKFDGDYSFQLSFFSMVAMIIFSFYELSNDTFSINLYFGWIFVLIIGIKLAVRTFLIENVIKKIDVGYFELFTKFGLIFMIIMEFLFLNYTIPLFVYLGFIIFFTGLIITLKFKTDKNLNIKTISILLLVALLFAVDPFLIRHIVDNGFLSLSMTYFFELLIGTLIIGMVRPKAVKFNMNFTKYFLPLSIVRMSAAYFAGLAILIGSPTVVELIKGLSLLLLFLIPVFTQNKILPLKTWMGIIISFIGISVIIFFK